MPYIIDPKTKKRVQIDPATGQPLAATPTPQPTRMSIEDTSNFKKPVVAEVKKEEVKEKPSFQGFVGNIFKSGIKTAKDIGSAAVNVFNPDLEKNTVANLGRLGVGTVELAIPGEQGAEKYAREVGKFYDDRFGISNILKGDIKGAAEKTGKTLYEDPVGLALDASILFSGGAGLASKASTLTKSSKLAKTAEVLNKASSVTNPIHAVSKIIGKAKTGAKVVKTGEALEKTSTKFGLKSIKPSPADTTNFKKAVGNALDNFQKENKLYGTTDQILKKTDDLIEAQQTIYNNMVRTGQQIKIKDFTKMLRAEADKLKAKGKLSPEITAKADALIGKAEFMEAQAGKSGLVTPDLIATAKGAAFKNVTPATMRDAAAIHADKIAGGLAIGFLDNYAKGSANVGKKLQALELFKNIIEKSEGKGVGSSFLSVPRVAAAAGGAAVGSVIPGAGNLGGALIGLGIEEALTSPRGVSLASRAGQAVGRGIQKLPGKAAGATDFVTPKAAFASRLNPQFSTGEEALPTATTEATPVDEAKKRIEEAVTPSTTEATQTTTITGHTLDEHAAALSRAIQAGDKKGVAQIKAQMEIEEDYQKRQEGSTKLELSDAAIKNVTDLQGAFSDITSLKESVTADEGAVYPGRGLIAKIPWATKAKSLQAEIDRVRQTVGKALEGGVLRKEDEEKYKKILLTLDDPREVALNKLSQLEEKITEDLERYIYFQRTYGKGADQPAVYQGSSPQFSDGKSAF